MFERRILRRIAGPIFENEIWRKRFNRELYEMLKDSDIINFIKINRLRWAGHVAWMDDKEIIKRILNSNPGGQRGRGRPKLRWIDGVEHDLRKIRCKNWKMVAQDRRLMAFVRGGQGPLRAVVPVMIILSKLTEVK